MSVEASELIADEWTRWQGHVVGGVFPLGRPLGHSAHSGVFLTHPRTAGIGQVAIKLVPAGHDQAPLARWQRAGQLAHPNLLALLESGACLLDGLPFHYVVMEYADQTLAQLLQRRALIAAEAREMLPPILDALTCLHAQGLAQGGLKPTNVLVVGDQLKLASDTVRLAGDPTDGQNNDDSTAGDIWGLGASLYEALTCRSPTSIGGRRHSVAMPADFPADFRDVVMRCLSHKPQDRPSAADLVAWTGGQPLKPISAAVQQPAAWARADEKASTALPTPARPPAPALATEPSVRAPVQVAWRPVILVAAGALALGLIVVTAFRAPRSPESVTLTPTADSASQPSALPSPVMAQAGTAVAALPARSPNPGDAPVATALHEQIPTVSRRAAATIRGHVKVSVRAEISAAGTVSRVVVDQGAGSRYFRQLALQAAKKWTFAPPAAGSARQMQIQFDFARDGTSAHAAPVQRN